MYSRFQQAQGGKYMTEAQILQLLGISYLAVGLGVLINPKFYQKLFKDFLDNYTATFISGFIALVVGYLLVVFYGCQAWSWKLLVPIFGVISLVKGIVILALPTWHIKIVRAFSKRKEYIVWGGAIVAIAGLALMYLGYFVV